MAPAANARIASKLGSRSSLSLLAVMRSQRLIGSLWVIELVTELALMAPFESHVDGIAGKVPILTRFARDSPHCFAGRCSQSESERPLGPRGQAIAAGLKQNHAGRSKNGIEAKIGVAANKNMDYSMVEAVPG